MVSLWRCKGVCEGGVRCRALEVEEKRMEMRLRAFLTGQEPREVVRELVLEQHTSCGCQCTTDKKEQCRGRQGGSAIYSMMKSNMWGNFKENCWHL